MMKTIKAAGRDRGEDLAQRARERTWKTRNGHHPTGAHSSQETHQKAEILKIFLLGLFAPCSPCSPLCSPPFYFLFALTCLSRRVVPFRVEDDAKCQRRNRPNLIDRRPRERHSYTRPMSACSPPRHGTLCTIRPPPGVCRDHRCLSGSNRGAGNMPAANSWQRQHD